MLVKDFVFVLPGVIQIFLREVVGAAAAMGLTIQTSPSTIEKSVVEFQKMDTYLLT